MKRILVFLGSSRSEGNTQQLADALIEGASSNGHFCEKIALSKMKIEPCLACEQCWSSTPCVRSDDLTTSFYKKIADADVLVFASPIYYYSWSGSMKLLFDRFYPFEKKPEQLHGKETILLAAAADTTPDAFKGTVASYESCCQFLEWKNCGMVLAHNTWKPGDVATSGDWLEQAKKIGQSL